MNNLEKLYQARENAAKAGEFNNGYLQALKDLENIYRDTERLTNEELADFIWDWLCETQDSLR